MYPVITISREFGSGGHAIGKAVAEKLDIPFLDREVVLKVAAEMGIDSDVVESKGEHASRFSKYLNTRFYNGLYIGDEQDEIFTKQKEIIIDCASKGPCVIVGRCSDHILREQGIPAFNVFIHADMELRRKNVAERFQSADVDISKLIEKNDRGRRYYYKYYTGNDWDDYRNYDISFNTSCISEEQCVDIIIGIIENMN